MLCSLLREWNSSNSVVYNTKFVVHTRDETKTINVRWGQRRTQHSSYVGSGVGPHNKKIKQIQGAHKQINESLSVVCGFTELLPLVCVKVSSVGESTVSLCAVTLVGCVAMRFSLEHDCIWRETCSITKVGRERSCRQDQVRHSEGL